MENPELVKKCETKNDKEFKSSAAPMANDNQSLLASYKTAVTSFAMARIHNGRILEKMIWTFLSYSSLLLLVTQFTKILSGIWHMA